MKKKSEKIAKSKMLLFCQEIIFLVSNIMQMFFVSPWCICSAQSRNQYHSRMALRKVRIPTCLPKVGILTLCRAILEWSLRKVGIWTKYE